MDSRNGFKLMVVSGPNRGATFAINEGETWLGRQSGNAVVLASRRVSKRHCVLVASDGQLLLKDTGSSNGTFVNGVLAREKQIKGGDRISVGEFVLEVVESKAARSNVIAFPSLPNAVSDGLPMSSQNISPTGSMTGSIETSARPMTFQEKASTAFDQYVMPIFYGLAMKNEWRLVTIGTFACFCVINMFISVSPLIQSSHNEVTRESARRASFMARQIADAAAPLVASRAESRVDIGAAENADGVKLAVVVDMDSRIIAPPSRQNQYLTGGGEAVLVNHARESFRKGRETGFWQQMDSSTVVAIEPLKAFDPTANKNVVIGMAVISIDTSLATMGLGDVGLVYSETLIITAVLGALALLILYRLTLKPLQILNDDMDKALKGDVSQVTHEFKWEELNPLWDLVNSAIQRIPKGSGALGGTGGVEPPLSAEDFASPFRSLANLNQMGVVICDSERKIVSINSIFEDLSGIRADSSVGQEISSVAREQALAALCTDLLDKAQPGSEAVGEDFDFSGVSYKVQALCFGTMGLVKCYVLIASRGGTNTG